MSTDFSSITPSEAPKHSEKIVVVVGSDGTPRWLVGPDGPGPVLAVDSSRPADEVVSVALLRTIAAGLPAVVVRDEDGALVGIIDAATLREEMFTRLAGAEAAVTGTLGDPIDVVGLGEFRTVGPIRVKCKRCEQMNELAEFPEPGRICVTSGHELEPEWA
jgi:hypothetical protein